MEIVPSKVTHSIEVEEVRERVEKFRWVPLL